VKGSFLFLFLRRTLSAPLYLLRRLFFWTKLTPPFFLSCLVGFPVPLRTNFFFFSPNGFSFPFSHLVSFFAPTPPLLPLSRHVPSPPVEKISLFDWDLLRFLLFERFFATPSLLGPWFPVGLAGPRRSTVLFLLLRECFFIVSISSCCRFVSFFPKRSFLFSSLVGEA